MVNQLAIDESDGKSRNRASHSASTFAAFSALASEARDAALRTLAGQLTHQMRNPLAAIQAACTSLREEIQDPDHQERLDLMLQEVTHMLDQISADVQAVAKPEERSHELDAAGEILSVVDILRVANPEAPEMEVQSQSEATCVAPRMAFRVAVYGLLEHLITEPSANLVTINVKRGNNHLQIRFTVATEAGDHGVAFEPLSSVDRLGLQIAERFARDTNGRLKRWMPENGSQVITLDLPCVHG